MLALIAAGCYIPTMTEENSPPGGPLANIDDPVRDITGIPTIVHNKLCGCCTHPQRQKIDWLIISRTATYAEIAEIYGINPMGISAHAKHTGLEKWKVSTNGLLSLLDALMASGLANLHKTKPSDMVRAVEISAKIQGLINDNSQVGSISDYIAAVTASGATGAPGAAAVAIDAEYTVLPPGSPPDSGKNPDDPDKPDTPIVW